MSKFGQKFELQAKRLVYQVHETGPVPKGDQEVLRGIAEKATKEAKDAEAKKQRDEAIKRGAEAGRASGSNPTNKPANAPAETVKPGEKKPLPELPKGLSELKVDRDKGVTKDGRVEHQFKFGGLNVPGKIIMPEKPTDGAKTTIMFNYVDDPEKFDHAKFLKNLKDSKIDLGNTMIVTIRTPEATTTVNRQQVNTMTQLTGEVEKFREEMLAKDPKYKNLPIPRAETILHMSARGDTELKKVSSLLVAYQKAAADKDPRVPAENLRVLNNDPDQFLASLEESLKPAESKPEEAAPATGDQPVEPEAVEGGSVGGGGGGSRSGSRGGSGGGGNSSESPATETPSDTTDPEATPAPAATADTAKPAEDETPDQTKSNPEVQGEGIDRVLILGDSLMELTQKKVADHYKSNIIETTAVRSKTLHQMLGELKARGNSLEKLNSEKCRGTIVVNGGVNDLAAGKTALEILADMEAMVAIAKQYKLKINFCALAPFGGTTYQSLQKDFTDKNQVRIAVNEGLYKLANVDGANVGVIPLDKGKSAGGLADDTNPDRLDPDYASKDGLHLSIGGPGNNSGTEAMAAAIEKHLGEPVTSASPKTPIDGIPSTPETFDNPVQTEKRLNPCKETSDEFYAWADKTKNMLINEVHLKMGVYIKLEYKGKPFLGILRPHSIIGATGKAAPPGTIGLEIYEYDADMDPEAQKKSPDSTVKRTELATRRPELRAQSVELSESDFEKQQPIMNGEVELALNLPKNFNPALPTELIVYATPNGQAPERTNGSGNQIARQAELLRSNSPDYRGKNLIIAYISPLSRKWEEYVGKNPSGGNRALQEVTTLVRNKFHPSSLDISFDSHSGGGAFAFNIMNERNGIPAGVSHLDFFDSIYYYHGEKHAGIIKKWLDSNQKNTITLVAGTPQIVNKQKQFVSDLEKLGVTFVSSTDLNNNVEYTAYNGRIRIKVLNTSDHGGTVTRNGFAYAHDPDGFDITNRTA